MKVKHTKPQRDLALATHPCSKFCYRTEVTNNNDVPIKIIWFEHYVEIHNGDGAFWGGGNITCDVLREEMFLKWYSDDVDDAAFKDGWLLPGQTAICDPNWCHWDGENELNPSKWSFIAVDGKGDTYFAEAQITKDVGVFWTPK